MSHDQRRVSPGLWHTDYLQLAPLAKLLAAQASALPQGAVIVDLGCGDMPYAGLMRGLGLDYRPADIDADAVAKGKLPIGGDGRVPLPDGAADAVMSVQVLEHVPDLDAYCAEIRRLLKPDGTLLLSTHGSWFYHPHPEDHRRWTRTGLALDLQTRGIVVEEMHSICGPLATTTMIRLTAFAFVLKKFPVLGPLVAGALSVVMNLRGLLEDAVTPRVMRDDNACIYLVRARVAA
ncbi:class I SAM-dependent methyltransferase [Novosphingobium umbonatum]|uniref:Class I SAM-dependent methyltransferase n=1 Tax=Novosphingobium umbonatum TaxID=1908524 RepID=A0A3S2URC8_9SPHN|nr:class I SAM-dependent methyltransferase [Novosphingobium umbonatum]RVU04292.1 class I SAM-dependent methyltransferase [Novosphingobium umbonatum]